MIVALVPILHLLILAYHVLVSCFFSSFGGMAVLDPLNLRKIGRKIKMDAHFGPVFLVGQNKYCNTPVVGQISIKHMLLQRQSVPRIKAEC